MTLTLHSTLHFGPNAVKAILKIASHLDFQKHRCEGEVNQTLRDWRKEENAQRAPRGRQLFAFLYFKSRVKALQTKDEPLCHAFVTKFYL